MPLASDNTGNDESLLARVLRQGFPRLHFPEPIESEFRADHLTSRIPWVRLCLLVAIGTSLGFSAIDHFVLRADNRLPDLVRYGLQMPMLLIIFVVAVRPSLVRWYPLVFQIAAPIYGFGSVLLVAYAQSEHMALVGSRLLLVSFFMFFMSGLRLPQALRCNLAVMTVFVLAGLRGLIPAEVVTYLSFAFVVSMVIGSVGLYALEHATRTSFLERRLLRELAEQDGLTRLLNRPNFDARARARWLQAASAGEWLTVLMIDVDNFKLYNDHYGHQSGDECLRRVASAVLAALSGPTPALVARYGGEEFIALVASREAQAAGEFAQRVVEAVAKLAIPHAAAPDRSYVSVSVGSADTDNPAAVSYEALARRADEALYAAKNRGRNCSVVMPMAETAAA